MDGVQLPQGYSHFEEAVYFLPFSSQKFLAFGHFSRSDFYSEMPKFAVIEI